MKELAKIDSIDELMSLFDSIALGVIFLDKKLKVLAVNTTASRDILNLEADKCKLSHCYSILTKTEQICDNCPFCDIEEAQDNIVKSYVFKDSADHNLYVKVRHNKWQDFYILTLHNVTKEVTLLKKIDLNRKAAEAKNILLERRWQKSQEQHEELKGIIDYLPEALVTVNNNLKIIQSNQAVANVLNTYPIGQCYELFGNDSPCSDCPAVDGFTEEQAIKKQLIDGKYYTELIIKSPNGEGGMLLFRETTRQIELIEQIRNQQETLSGLVELADLMQKEDDIKKVLQIFLDKLLPAISTDAAILLIDEIRPGNLWQTMNINNNENLFANIAKAYLARDVQTSTSGVVDKSIFPWQAVTQISLRGVRGKRVGLLCLPGDFVDAKQEKVYLFTKSLGAYIDSKLLMRQLEEKADTDQMTGLYNRGYLDRAIVEERNKLEKYNINFSIVAVDINRLKQANDVYGHEAGDMLIKTVAERLQKSLREADIVARVGGDEFLVLLTNTGDKGAQAYTTRLRHNYFTDSSIKVKNNEDFPVTVSLGTAGTDCYSPDDLKKQADMSMYIDKEAYYKYEKKYR